MNLFHVDFEMVGPLEDLAARLARVRHKPALVLVSHVAQKRTLEVENARADGALKLGALRRVTHGVHRVRVCYPLEAGGWRAEAAAAWWRRRVWRADPQWWRRRGANLSSAPAPTT